MIDRWFPYRDERPDALLRLFCFSYAGGSAAVYKAWQALLPDCIELCAIQLPGRDARYREPAYRSMNALLDDLQPRIGAMLDRRFAFFGYSAGAAMAHALAIRTGACRTLAPCRLFAAACAAPPYGDNPYLHSTLDESEFEARVLDLNAAFSGHLDNRELMRLCAPIIRADLEIIESFDPPNGPALRCPVSVFGGTRDPLSPPDALTRWASVTTGPCEIDLFDGDHFFIHGHSIGIARRISEILARDRLLQ